MASLKRCPDTKHEAFRSRLRLHHEFNSLHRSRGVLVDQGHITRRQVGEFPLPSPVGNFHSQNAAGKTQRPSPIGHGTATRDGPGQQRALARRRAMKSFGDDGFQAGGSAIQGMTPESGTRSKRRFGTAMRTTMIVASENVTSLCEAAAYAAAAAATLARFLARLRRYSAEYRLPRQRLDPHKHGASCSPS